MAKRVRISRANCKKATDINDITEVSSLTDSLKQVMFQDYKTCYNKETEEGIVV